MSFILDALKKSEIERQEQAGPSMSHVREARPERRRSVWIAAIAALLIVNLIVIAFFALRTGGSDGERRAPERETPVPADEPAPAAAPRRPAAASQPSGERAIRPLEAEVQPRERTAPPPAANLPVEPRAAAAPAGPPPSSNEPLPTFNELVVQGRLALPPMHIDIHVFSDKPSSRFVFIDGRKYQEGDRLANGPEVEEITDSGVVLSHQGQRFLLPRQ